MASPLFSLVPSGKLQVAAFFSIRGIAGPPPPGQGYTNQSTRWNDLQSHHFPNVGQASNNADFRSVIEVLTIVAQEKIAIWKPETSTSARQANPPADVAVSLRREAQESVEQMLEPAFPWLDATEQVGEQVRLSMEQIATCDGYVLDVRTHDISRTSPREFPYLSNLERGRSILVTASFI
jgi:hypothetical protein